MQLESYNKKERIDYPGSYIGFTSFYRSVAYPDNSDFLFIADSMTKRGDMRFFFPEQEVACQGIVGDTTESMLNRVDYAINCNLKKLIIQVGINNLS